MITIIAEHGSIIIAYNQMHSSLPSILCVPFWRFVKWGTYRTHSQVVHRASKKWKQDASTALVALDHLWWRMRNHLDGYLEAAEWEVRSVQASFMALSNYENCQADLEGLLKSYASSMSTMKKSHRKLEHTWREVSNLLGELSSVLRDGDVFGVFVQAEGCASPLAKQTLQQASEAFQ